MEPKRLTDDDLRAIRARDEAYAHAYKIWNSQRNPDSDFYDDTPIPHPSAPEDRAALLAHADALAARVARLREERELWELALKAYAWDGAWDSGRRWMGPEDGPLVARRALEGGA